MKKKPNYRWRPASWNVGQRQKPQATTVVVNPPASGPSTSPSIVVATTKSPGATIAVVLGIGAVAFAVMELTGVTHVFATAPVAPPPIPPPKPAGSAAANPTSAAITAATQAITSAAK